MLVRKNLSELTEDQRAEKLTKDNEYEQAVHNLSTPFYQKKRSVGVSTAEEQTYVEAKKQLWDDYCKWAELAGLYKEVSKEDELSRAEDRLNEVLEIVNKVRGELGRELLEVKERG